MGRIASRVPLKAQQCRRASVDGHDNTYVIHAGALAAEIERGDGM